MKLCKRIISILLVVLMLVPAFAEAIAGLGIESLISGSVYKIANDYVRFTYDADTGAFSVETKDGHPQKSFDNNIPLLYNESAARSNGTSYTTVRIDGKDYIFGQDYGYFGIETDIYTPVITNGGRVMSVSWGVKGYLITQTAIISEVEDSDLAEIIPFYKDTFLPSKLTGLKQAIDADEETAKAFNQLKFTEGVINGRIAVVESDEEAAKRTKAKKAANKAILAAELRL